MRFFVVYGTHPKVPLDEQHVIFSEKEKQKKVRDLSARRLKVIVLTVTEPKWAFMSRRQQLDYIGGLPWPGDKGMTP